MIERVPGKFEKLAWERHERDLALASTPGGHPRGLTFDAAAGDRVVTFLETYCRHHKGEWAGRPLILEQWQKDMVRQAFGWMRTSDGTRRFRTLYWEEPRKNGKSEIGGGLALYLTIADHEPGAEVYSSATKKDQAKLVWDTGAAMVRKSPELKPYVRVMQNSIICEETGSKFQALGADADTLDGLNPHGNIVDELHAHKDRKLWDVLDTAMGSRRQPMTLAITTAGTYDPESIGWQMHQYATDVLEGVIEDDSFHAVIFAADPPTGEDSSFYFTEAAWRQANPNFGVSVKPSYLQGQAEKAKNQPSFFNTFLRLHLNVWTLAATRWLSMERWNESDPIVPGGDARALAKARELLLLKRRCFGGLDLASKLDLTAFVLAFPGEGTSLDLICRFWLPEATLAKYLERKQIHYDTWARLGWLTVTPGDVVDYDFIRDEVVALSKLYDVREIAYDPWGATHLSTQLMGEGLTMVEAHQGFKTLSEPSKDLEARTMQRVIRHMNNPVMRFCASNAVTEGDAAGNIKPSKATSKGKIDGVVALIMALSRIICAPADPESVYQARPSFLQLGADPEA